MQTSLEALDFLSTELKSARADEFKTACASQFPLSTAFKTAEEQAAIRKEIDAASAPEELKPELDSL